LKDDDRVEDALEALKAQVNKADPKNSDSAGQEKKDV